eukprot:CAMPEP_0117544256 /NCGR_PEP_ID=MMETSP0784-20121206/45477_1 /TAXON_ID=39447 /ORGANISM="" /LENGTH=257 /DNA_ID=CAMNT_0005341049 /DNA_START=27 /DNA_END=797 /DNA_ORIENTATION=-
MHQYFSETVVSELVAPPPEPVVVQCGNRDYFNSRHGPRSFAVNDELVSERTAELARQHLSERSQRDGVRNFQEWSRSLGDTAALLDARGEECDNGGGETNYKRLTEEECEHYEAQLQAERSVASRRAEEMRAFREDKRMQAPAEDPLDLLEWKAPADRVPRVAASVRAVLGVRKRRRVGASGRPADQIGRGDQPADPETVVCSSAATHELRPSRNTQVVEGPSRFGAAGAGAEVPSSSPHDGSASGAGLLAAYESDS